MSTLGGARWETTTANGGELLSDYEPPTHDYVEEPEGLKLGMPKHGKLDLAPRTCEACGREYKPTNNRQKYCKECAGKRISRQASERYERYKEQPDFARRRKAAQQKYEDKVRKCKNSARKR